MENAEELKKQAQEKLAEARRLINEAGELAKQGQFHLHFGEIGDFYPKKLLDRESYREVAVKHARENGLERYNRSTGNYDTTPFDQLDSGQQHNLVYELMEEFMLDETGLGVDDAEYIKGDRWWHPSRC